MILSRRHLRSKGLQALYAFFQSDNADIAKGEKELLVSIDKVYDLYLYQLSLITEIIRYAGRMAEEGKQKKLPTPEDLAPNTRFIDNQVIAKLNINRPFLKALEARKINWINEQEFIKKFVLAIKESEEYKEQLSSEDSSFEADKNFLIQIYKSCIADSEQLQQYLEEHSIYWMDDMELVNSMIVKTIKSFSEASGEFHPILPLYKDEEDDKKFIVDLFRKTILNNKEYEELIAEKTQNWDVERIALMDILIMKMAICEVLNFPSIPVKVTLNEYIDISKRFSTPKSKVFINGILDKIIIDFKTQDRIKKTGRGLLQ